MEGERRTNSRNQGTLNYIRPVLCVVFFLPLWNLRESTFLPNQSYAQKRNAKKEQGTLIKSSIVSTESYHNKQDLLEMAINMTWGKNV